MSLQIFSEPEAVTVVGASDDPAKWGWWLASGALRGEERRPVHLVNRRGGEVLGRRVAQSVGEVDGEPGLVVLGVPPIAVRDVVDDALAHGARGFLGITAGLGAAAEQALIADVHRHGARMVGPNCLGLYDADAELQLAWGRFRPGRLAIVSQSGQVGSELANLAAVRGLGVSRFVSVGNQVDVTAAEVVVDLADHGSTSVVAVYLEGFGDGRALVRALTTLAEAGLPTLLLTVGRSPASRAAALTHTGALTSDLAVVDAACRASGAVRVDTPSQLVDAALLMTSTGRVRGNRVAVVSDSGGQAALAGDVLTAAGVVLPHAPVDLAGAGERDLTTYAAVVEEVVEDADAVLMTGYFGSYGDLTPSLAATEAAVADQLAATASRHDRPVVVHSMATGSATMALLAEQGVAGFATVEAAAGALGAAARRTDPRALPEPAVTVPGPTGPDGYWSARSWLAGHGVPFPSAVLVDGAVCDLVAAPFVLKADWVAHKTEQQAVRVGLPDREAVIEAHDEMRGRLGAGRYVVEHLDDRPDVVELVVAARLDPSFGAVVTVGAGGIHAELLRDVVVELAPLTRDVADVMLRRLRCLPLLEGWRGRPAVDVGAVADLLVTLGDLVHRSPVTEVELNPVRVGPDGLLAVDALVVR